MSTDEHQRYTSDFRHVLTAERAHLKLAADLGRPDGIALALSGGGIRSASFALGVVQALINRGWFDRFDYLSTVSGGGYLGAALTWLKFKYKDEFKRQLGSATSGARSAEAPGVKDAPGTWLDFIRQHGNYLEPGFLGAFSLFGVVVRGVLLSVAVYGGAISVLFALFGGYLPVPHCASSLVSPRYPIEFAIDSLALLLALHIVLYGLATWLAAVPPFLTIAGAVVVTALAGAAVMAVSWGEMAGSFPLSLVWLVPLAVTFATCLMLLFAAVRSAWANKSNADASSWHYRARTVLQRALAALIATLLTLIVIWSVPKVIGWIGVRGGAIAGAGTLTVGGAIAALKSLSGAAPKVLKYVPQSVLISLGALVAIYALLLLGYWVQDGWFENTVVLMSVAAAVIIAGFIVDANYIGPGRMYRDRLMEAFMPDEATIAAGQWRAATEADAARISVFKDTAPYHLVNCNAVLVDAFSDKFRGRGGDSFVIAPLLSGSTATGWVASDSLGGHRGVPLSTAMAISGAAVNPDAGGAGRGPTRDRGVAFLMWLFNVRLGYWLRNPGTGWVGRRLAAGPPNFWFPGIVQGLLGQHLRESAAFVELSDGGHFDNTALYELVRRRVKLIVVSEAGADPNGTLEDLANSIERVRVDFGVHIRFDVPGLDTTALKKTSKDDPHVKRGYAIATIYYPQSGERPPPGQLGADRKGTGYLLYLQAVPIAAMEARPDVESYRTRHPAFPNESTINQFFTEEQLEAYRELGLMIANQAIDAIVRPTPHPDLKAAAEHLEAVRLVLGPENPERAV